MSEPKNVIVCDYPECTAEIPYHRWGKIKAEGWFFSKGGTSFCNNHPPAWLMQWRNRKEA